jgi:UDPglucose--hexose-1-phosphate uridylyltransferase
MFKTTLTKPDGRALYLYSTREIPAGIVATNPKGEALKANPHFRWHPLRQEWVIYAGHRQNRTFLPPRDYSPLSVSTSQEFPTEMPEGDYDVAVFENLFPSLNLYTEESPTFSVPTRPAKGVCEVVVFTKDPDSSLGDLPLSRIELILEVLGERTKELGKLKEVQYVMPFENRGIEMGVTLHHPHGQIYSYPFIPPVQQTILDSMKKHYDQFGEGLLDRLIQNEITDNHRVTFDSKHSLAFIPVFARYPYETWIAPKREMNYLYELNHEERRDLAISLKTTLMKFDALWKRPFPYLMTLFQAPFDGVDHPEAHLFFQITPPYRSKDRLKYLAGTELGAGIFVNDSYPEEKAQELESVNVEFNLDE